MSKKVKPIPKFHDEDEERAFWATHDSTEYVDPKKLIRVPPLTHLKNAGEPIMLILPQDISKEVKALAKKHHLSSEEMIEQIIALDLKNRRDPKFQSAR
jgi:hypothetical protein